MILTKNTPYTTIDLWFPKYSTKYSEIKEYCALPAKYKIDDAPPHIVITFSKAKHLRGIKFYITRTAAQTYKLQSNGSIFCYVIPMSHLQIAETGAEVRKKAFDIFDD